jgi:hypothetical protein
MRVRIGSPDLEALISQLEAHGTSPNEPLLSEICEALGCVLGVQSGEVALLEITPDRLSLQFVLPAKLRQAGSVPLEAEGGVPLSARTVLEGQPSIVNDFVSHPHARVFEGVPLGLGATAPIQKIMSTPVFGGGLVIGVAQVSRKGFSATAAGPDFTAQDLIQLQELNNMLGRIVKAGGTAPPKKELTDAELKRIPPSRQRRSSRVTISIPIEVIHQGPKNEIIVEETQTLSVSAYGAGIALKTAQRVGQTVVLIHAQSREELLCRVRSTRPIPKSTNHEVGIAFEQSAPTFWHINFPPEDWDPSVRKLASAPRDRT